MGGRVPLCCFTRQETYPHIISQTLVSASIPATKYWRVTHREPAVTSICDSFGFDNQCSYSLMVSTGMYRMRGCT